MPSAFTVTTSPLTANGTLAVTGAGTASQYVRGDGTLALLPTSGGGGTAVSYYLNGSVASSVALYQQMSKIPAGGGATNFSVTNTTGFALVKQFVTDANDPSLLNIPAGAWDINLYFGVNNNSGSPQFYVELWKSDATGTTFTLISSGSGTPESITNGTTVDLYTTSLAVSSTPLTITDRLVVRVYADTDGATRTVTLYTEGSRLAQIITTFSSGLTSLNGLNAQTQFFATPGTTGTAPAWTSSTATHTLNIPLASAASVTAGLISNTEFNTFNGKLANVLTTTGDIIYSSSGTTASRLGIGTIGQVLAVSGGGVPFWSSAGSGDVVGPAGPVIDGNFAVFDSTTGKIIKESAGASLSAAGAAVFNTSLALGVGGTTTGQLIFRNSANAFTTTIQASTSAAANLSYTWPQIAPTVGQILSSDASGNLSWTAAGAGDMTLAGTQTVTGTKTFNAGSIRINNATNNGYHILASAAAASGTLTATFPAATGTVPFLSLAQTFSALQSYSAGVTVSGGVTTFSHLPTTSTPILISGNGSTTNPHISFTGTTINWMSFGTTGIAAPTLINAGRSAGTKVVIIQGTGATLDSAIGGESSGMWLSSAQAIRFYTNASTTVRAAFDGDASNSNLTLTNATAVSIVAVTATTANVFNTIATTVNMAGAATTLNINNNTLAQTINIGTTSTQASTYNFGTGATVSGVTKAINIGTGGAAGSTTNITFGTSATTNLRFFGSANTSGKPTVSGSRGGNAALASFLTAMSNLGLITDSTTA
jgi:hypothetical protein